MKSPSLRWILSVSIAETTGFAIATVVAVALIAVDAPSVVALPSIIVAGAIEGAVLGIGQAVAFGPGVVEARSWILATSAGAAIAWTIGMLPSTLGLTDVRSPWAIALLIIGALTLLASIPTLQWIVLRERTTNTAWWIPVTAGAWLVAVLWTAAPSPFIDETTPLAVVFAAYAAVGLLMALTMAMLTAPAARRVRESVTARRARGTARASRSTR